VLLLLLLLLVVGHVLLLLRPLLVLQQQLRYVCCHGWQPGAYGVGRANHTRQRLVEGPSNAQHTLALRLLLLLLLLLLQQPRTCSLLLLLLLLLQQYITLTLLLLLGLLGCTGFYGRSTRCCCSWYAQQRQHPCI
jgi:hypothetical protein